MLRRLRLPLAMFGLATVLFFVGALGFIGNPSASSSAPAVEVPVAATHDLAGTVAALQARLRVLPNDFSAWASLGLAYIEQAKARVNPEFYPKAQGALERSLAINTGENFVADAGMSALAAARHEFAQALVWAQKGLAINSSSATLYGTLADAQIQLGNYDDAFAATQRMVDLSPDTNSLTRASYAWEIRGDITQARALMGRALESASSSSQRAFTRYYLGELALNSGDPKGAAVQFDAGLSAAPDYAALFEGKARAAAAEGDVDGALKLFAAAVDRVPQPMYLVEYGELLQSVGRDADAKVQYSLFETEQKLFAANGVAADVEPTLFYADHGDPAHALESAAAGLRTRPFLEMQDAYAWALHVNGRDTEARQVEAKALALGTRNALFEFHAGIIERSLGNASAARVHLAKALAINPAFNPLHAPEARAALHALGGA